MTSPLQCVECDATILAATAARTNGRCMPCKQRRRVHLSPEQEVVFRSVAKRYEDLGWSTDAPTKRAWLEISQALRTLVRKDPARAWEALAICELDVAATKEPALDVYLALGTLRTASANLFPAENIREAGELV